MTWKMTILCKAEKTEINNVSYWLERNSLCPRQLLANIRSAKATLALDSALEQRNRWHHTQLEYHLFKLRNKLKLFRTKLELLVQIILTTQTLPMDNH